MAEPRRYTSIGAAGQRLAENLRRIRSTRGLTTEQLAGKLVERGVTINPSSITKIEKQDRRVTVDEMAALANALDVEPVALLRPEGTDASSIAEEIKEFVAARVPVRPFLVEVTGYTDPRRDRVGIFMGDSAMEGEEALQEVAEHAKAPIRDAWQEWMKAKLGLVQEADREMRKVAQEGDDDGSR